MPFDGVAQFKVVHLLHQKKRAQNGYHRADDLHGFGALVGVVRRLRHLLHGGAGLLRLGGLPHPLGRALSALPRCPVGILLFVAALAELDEQQDQADGPRHGKHDGDEDPRADVVVLLRRLGPLRPESVVVVVFVCHQDLNPFPCSFRLLPCSSTI